MASDEEVFEEMDAMTAEVTAFLKRHFTKDDSSEVFVTVVFATVTMAVLDILSELDRDKREACVVVINALEHRARTVREAIEETNNEH